MLSSSAEASLGVRGHPSAFADRAGPLPSGGGRSFAQCFLMLNNKQAEG